MFRFEILEKNILDKTEEEMNQHIENMLLDFLIEVFNSKRFPKDLNLKQVKEFIHEWVEVHFAE